jgi:hypothetical protein
MDNDNQSFELEVFNKSLIDSESELFKIYTTEFKNEFKKYKNYDTVVMPFDLMMHPEDHANLLIYKPKLKELYRYEPHGEGFDNPKVEEAVNNRLKLIVDYSGLGKYIPPSESCPIIPKSINRGFQAMENNFGIKNVGFCQLWSVFMLELIILNPKIHLSEVYKIGHNVLQNKPIYFSQLIKGYFLYLKEEREILKKK